MNTHRIKEILEGIKSTEGLPKDIIIEIQKVEIELQKHENSSPLLKKVVSLKIIKDMVTPILKDVLEFFKDP